MWEAQSRGAAMQACCSPPSQQAALLIQHTYLGPGRIGSLRLGGWQQLAVANVAQVGRCHRGSGPRAGISYSRVPPLRGLRQQGKLKGLTVRLCTLCTQGSSFAVAALPICQHPRDPPDRPAASSGALG